MGVVVEGLSPFAPGYDSTISGIYVLEDGKPKIYFNLMDPPNRQRFTVAHELGHHVLKHGPRFRDTSATLSGGSYDPIETSANRFAAELLMPTHPMKVLVEEQGIVSLPTLAASFGVSEKAMHYRLKNLGYIR